MNNLYSSPWAGSQNLQPDFRSEHLTMSHLAVDKAYAGKTLPNGAPVINRVLAFAKPLEVFGPPVQAAAMSEFFKPSGTKVS